MVLFREMTDDDREAVAAIADRRLGESYQYGFETIIAREDCPAIVAVEDGSVIGTELAEQSLEAMTPPIYALAWVRDGHYDSRSLLEKLGFMKK